MLGGGADPAVTFLWYLHQIPEVRPGNAMVKVDNISVPADSPCPHQASH